MNLFNWRNELEGLYQNLFHLLNNRRHLIQKIMQQKSLQGLMVYDKNRELELFNLFQSQIKLLSKEELLAISLIIEGQARKASSDYPSWSRGLLVKDQQEINEDDQTYYSRVNPNMLKIYDTDIFERLYRTE